MNLIKNYYSKLSLKNKLRISFILLILFPAALICVVYWSVASNSILEVVKQNNLDLTMKNTQIIDQSLASIQTGAVKLNVDPDLYIQLDNMDSVLESELLVKDKRIQTILKKYFSEDFIISSTIMTPRFVFGDNTQLVIPNNKFFDSSIYEKSKEEKGVYQWVSTYEVEKEYKLDYKVDNNVVFSLVQALNPVLINPEKPNNVQYMDIDAVLVVTISQAWIYDLLQSSNGVKDSFFCISTLEGDIVSHSDSEMNGKKEILPWLQEAKKNKNGSILLRYQNQEVVVCYAKSEVTGWMNASITPVHSFLDNVFKLQLFTVFLLILLFLLAMFLSEVFSSHITLPVERLVKAMKQLGKGNFNLRLPVNGSDELQYLTEKYNDMGEKIQILVEENYKSEIRKKEMEIMALNLQLNPHFLYNTLNIINMMALEDGNEEISKMLISLSDMLQYTFRNKQELVIFEEEYQWLQNYIHIMKTRFENKFTVRYMVSKELFRYKIPKLLLQPLVENAIVHGFGGMDEGGILEIEGSHDSEVMQIVIWDNGEGMNEEQLKKAMSGDYNRIGLSNVVQRLNLLYGEKGKIEVETEKEQGTRIFVKFPLTK